MNPIYNLRHKIQMLKDFLQLLSTGPVTAPPPPPPPTPIIFER